MNPMSSVQLVHEHRPPSVHPGYLGYLSASFAHISPAGLLVLEPTKSFHEDIKEF